MPLAKRVAIRPTVAAGPAGTATMLRAPSPIPCGVACVRRLIALSALLGIFFTQPAMARVDVAKADAAVRAFMAQEGIPAAHVTIFRGDEVILQRGYGSVVAGGPAPDAASIFPLGSISKQFTAAAIMALVDAGKVRLDARVGEYLPEWFANEPGLRVSHLLSQTSGLADFLWLEGYRPLANDAATPIAAYVALAAAAPRRFAPGTRWAYSNTNYKALALIAERVTGEPFDSVVARRVLEPAGLEGIVSCHSLRPDQFVPGVSGAGKPTPLDASAAAYAGDGGLCASAAALSKWLRLVLAAPNTNASRLARPNQLADGTQVPYGFGLSTREFLGHRMVWHGGNVDSHSTMIAFLPDEDIGLVVKRQEVISRRVESGHGCDSSDALVWAMPVVVVDPVVQGFGALAGVLVGERVGPFAQRGLDEAFGLAVGLWAIGAREALRDAQLAAGLPEGPRAEGTAVVGQQPLDTYAERAVVGHRVAQELHCAGRSLIGVHIGKADAGVIIDRHEQELPTGARYRVASVAGDPMAGPLDAAEFLDVDVQQVAGRGMLVALHGFDRLQSAQRRQAGPCQYAAHGAGRDVQGLRDPSLGQAAPAQLHNAQRLARCDRARTAQRARAAVGQARLALEQETTQPLTGGRSADAVRGGRRARRQSMFNDVSHHLNSTRVRQSGILMSVHSAELL